MYASHNTRHTAFREESEAQTPQSQCSVIQRHLQTCVRSIVRGRPAAAAVVLSRAPVECPHSVYLFRIVIIVTIRTRIITLYTDNESKWTSPSDNVLIWAKKKKVGTVFSTIIVVVMVNNNYSSDGLSLVSSKILHCLPSEIRGPLNSWYHRD